MAGGACSQPLQGSNSWDRYDLCVGVDVWVQSSAELEDDDELRKKSYDEFGIQAVKGKTHLKMFILI